MAVCGSIFFIMLIELRFLKWVRFFEQNCVVKWVFFFTCFVGFETFCQKIWNWYINSIYELLIICFLVQILFFGIVLGAACCLWNLEAAISRNILDWLLYQPCFFHSYFPNSYRLFLIHLKLSLNATYLRNICW